MCVCWHVYGIYVAFYWCWTRGSEVTVKDLNKVVSFFPHVAEARYFTHQTTEWINTQNPVGDFPITSRQELRSGRIYGAIKRNMVVAFRSGHDVKVSSVAGMRELLRDGNNVLSLENDSEHLRFAQTSDKEAH